jgi:chromosome segregation ATPase
LQQQIATRNRELADLTDKLRREQESGQRLLGELELVRAHNHDLSGKVTALEAQNGGAAGKIQALQEKVDGLIKVIQSTPWADGGCKVPSRSIAINPQRTG